MNEEIIQKKQTGRLPVAAIVGRPNVGKSTLFNRLIGVRKAIVGDRPGVTVDRLESEFMLGDRHVILVDTGGIGEGTHDIMQPAIDIQVDAALEIADIVIFTVDAQSGATGVDAVIADKLRRQGMPLLLVVNKAERENSATDFYGLGLGEPLPVSAIHGQGMPELLDALAELLPEMPDDQALEEEEKPLANIAVIGRPNVGKSTLINAWLGRDRMVVSEIAGTTRDAIDSMLPFQDGFVRLVDTAGQRKHGRISDVIEFVARVKAVQAFRMADVAVMLLDGAEGIVEQDMRLMQLAQDEGCALIVAVNKLDLLSEQEWKYFAERLNFRMRGMTDIPVYRVTAKQGKGVKQLLHEAVKASVRNHFTIGTGELNRWLGDTQEAHHAPSDDGSMVRMKYASQTGTNPPSFKIFCNRPGKLKPTYKRYLEQAFRKTFDLSGVPIRFSFVGGTNPYADKGNK
ncbi:ribosome biogenesis GTPase Der [Mariprofundus ferrooxydans]|uniref:GTPase Der n=1 Tax=Mariprofundus ferrooxydans PV-1 TaxID=314345 RepID=Q0EXK7_9PROT|nr:ribosome biogenesis GTPase Der [Mariprofundus ferrooxydans]EAU54040.1 GTP-binding protein EngA [Mariprofundus ferrooxydans PV-1]KON46598.1 GTP-binding protein EngA [Mariprofundus ferrooxydans]